MAQPDLSYTFTTNTARDLCGGSSDKVCSDYSYVEVIFNNFDSSSFCSNVSFLSFWSLPFGSNLYFYPCISTHYNFYPLSASQLQAAAFYGLADWFQSGGSITVDFYSSAPSGPSGSLTLTENGTYDVTNYAEAVVDVPPVYGDYHDDLVAIKDAIFIGAATLLVIYFFYCIYRLILKPLRS